MNLLTKNTLTLATIAAFTSLSNASLAQTDVARDSAAGKSARCQAASARLNSTEAALNALNAKVGVLTQCLSSTDRVCPSDVYTFESSGFEVLATGADQRTRFGAWLESPNASTEFFDGDGGYACSPIAAAFAQFKLTGDALSSVMKVAEPPAAPALVLDRQTELADMAKQVETMVSGDPRAMAELEATEAKRTAAEAGTHHLGSELQNAIDGARPNDLYVPPMNRENVFGISADDCGALGKLVDQWDETFKKEGKKPSAELDQTTVLTFYLPVNKLLYFDSRGSHDTSILENAREEHAQQLARQVSQEAELNRVLDAIDASLSSTSASAFHDDPEKLRVYISSVSVLIKNVRQASLQYRDIFVFGFDAIQARYEEVDRDTEARRKAAPASCWAAAESISKAENTLRLNPDFASFDEKLQGARSRLCGSQPMPDWCKSIAAYPLASRE